MKAGFFWIGLLLAVFAAERSMAQETCRLELFTEVPITTLPDGRFSVPVELNGTKMDFLFDTGGAASMIKEAHVISLGMGTSRMARGMAGVAGNRSDEVITVEKFSLGRLPGGPEFLYIREALPFGVDGLLGAEFMKRFDVDIDFARGTVKLFSQKHCPGQVVHWTGQGYVVLPMNVTKRDGHIEVPVKIDGKTFQAILDTGARNSIISMKAAGRLKISEKSPELKLVTDKDAEYSRYDYPFKALDMDGLTVNRPRLQIVSDNYIPGGIDMILGVGILRQLHVYIAYDEEKLYITPALQN